MFDWVKVRAYDRLMSSAERWLIRKCWEQWKKENELDSDDIADNERWRLAEGFEAGWLVAKAMDADNLSKYNIKTVYDDIMSRKE